MMECWNDGITYILPGGYVDEKGIVHREVELSPLTGKEEELVAQNHRQESALLVTMVLSRCLRRLGSISPVPADVTGRLPKEDRQFLLLKLREITFGDMVQATVTCPGHDCGNKVDINFSTKDITDREQVDKEPQIELELEANCPGCGREFTIPFDIPNFFFRELRTTIDLLYREVHFLAYHYHWSEQEILEMSREKRHKYIEILLEEIEKMTDERILPPVGFRYGNVNYPFMLDSRTNEPLSRYLYPLEENNEMEVNEAQDPIDDDDGHEMNYHRKKTKRKDPMKNETPQDSEMQGIEIIVEENPTHETRKRENIEIPGFSEKSIAFPSLDRENRQAQKPESGGVPPSVGVNLVFTQNEDKSEFQGSLPVKNNVTEIETQLPEEIGEIKDSNTVELEKIESSEQEHQPGRAGTQKAILATEDTENTEAGGTRSPKGHRNSLSDIGITSWNKNKKLKESSTELKKNLLSVNSVPSVAKNILPENGKISAIGNQIINSKSQISNPELQTNSNPQMLKKSQTLDREKRHSQKPESGGVPSSVGVNLVFTQKENKIEFPDSLPVKDNVTEIETQLPEEIEDSNTVELEQCESPGQEHQPGRAGTQKAILATEDTENTELKKNLLSVNSVPSVAKNILPENGKISAIGNQIPNSKQIQDSELQLNSKTPIPNSEIQIISQPQMLNRSQTSDRENPQSQKTEVVEDKVIETQLPGRREKSGDYEVRTGESKVKVIPGEKMVSRSNPEAALRIEQLREQVRRLNQSKTLNPEISSFAPSGAEVNREIETEEQEQIPNPPIQPVTMVKRLPTRTKTHQTACAFWERSYLGRFHLRTLR